MSGSIVTIVTPSPTIDLTTLATAKEELGVTGSTPSDAVLTRWIHEVSQQIATRCRRTFGRETVSELFNLPTGTRELKLSRFPVAQVDSITEDATTLLTTDWQLDVEAGIIYRLAWGYPHAWFFPNVTVVYQAGYQLLGELPYDIERAALLLLRYRHQAGQRDPLVRSEAIPGKYEVSYWVGSVPGASSSLPADVEEILAPYTDPVV